MQKIKSSLTSAQVCFHNRPSNYIKSGLPYPQLILGLIEAARETGWN